MQGTRVRALVRKIPHVTEQLSPCTTTTELMRLKPVRHNRRSHRSEKPTHLNEEKPSLTTARESRRAATKTQCSRK